MYKRIISLLLCAVICLSFSLIAYSEKDDRIPQAGDHVFFGHYEQDNDLKNGPEPIEWRVLEVKGNEMFLISEYILDGEPYNEETAAHFWSTSSIRKWLNETFFHNAFSEDETWAICLTEVDNSTAQSEYCAHGSENTKDKLFFLSPAELRVYFGSPSDALCKATNFALPRLKLLRETGSYSFTSYRSYVFAESYENETYAPWWLRSPIRDTWDKAGIMVNSETNSAWPKNAAAGGTATYNSVLGVRPVMWVDINQYLDLLPSSEPESEINTADLSDITCDESITADTVLGNTAWKMWLPEGFTADELTEADIADDYIGYYLRDDDIIAVQFSDNNMSLSDWQKELADRGFSITGLYNLNGSEAVLYRNENADTMTASVLDGKGNLLEVTFYPYSTMTEEADRVISSIQQEASKRRLSGAAGDSSTASGSGGTNNAVPTTSSQEEAYQEMVAAYMTGKYKESYSNYEQVKGYQDADKYGNLLKARLCYDLKLKDSEIEALEEAIVNDIDFADSKDVLVCNSQMAHYYLLGYWRTSNGMHGYEVRPDWYSNTTVPAIPRSGDYYTILDGTYWSYYDGKWDDRIAQYKFTPISKNKMEMYSYQVKQSYTFNKVR